MGHLHGIKYYNSNRESHGNIEVLYPDKILPTRVCHIPTVGRMAMGLPLLPEKANIYIEYFNEMALETEPLRPTVWLR